MKLSPRAVSGSDGLGSTLARLVGVVAPLARSGPIWAIGRQDGIACLQDVPAEEPPSLPAGSCSASEDPELGVLKGGTHTTGMLVRVHSASSELKLGASLQVVPQFILGDSVLAVNPRRVMLGPPTAHMLVGFPEGPSCLHISGAMYTGVPTKVAMAVMLSVVHVVSTSASLTTGSSLSHGTRMFGGLDIQVDEAPIVYVSHFLEEMGQDKAAVIRPQSHQDSV
ncbi:hypothetical protein C8A05DRAFT_34683 [Staphylotrichum tortipilum]|uniref:Uncharacterized protein n=1 Tax=Staphylotrichum tortipilum TaxID=2831512 RepID=A0AAN6RT68_9PEZI|nr:hypothetical protein C8A05DRAFT_34683 [Staphylotrichum longicolle]